MQHHQHVLSCDWGTTSFRLRLFDTSANVPLAEVVSDRGNATLFNEWKTSDSDRVLFYATQLKEAIEALSAKSGVVMKDLPVIISGMASSSVGMKELPYADLPFSLDGGSAHAEWIDVSPVLNNPVLLISGVQQIDDVMRGEETQLAGIANQVDLSSEQASLFILPGTHSKHITVSNHRIGHFKTFMTGEIFELLTKHSILSHAVQIPGKVVLTDDDKTSFSDGVSRALESELLNSLFSVRINQLKKYLSPQQNYFYLSGLLIGSEIKYIRKADNIRMILCSSGRLLLLYQLALGTANLLERTTVVPPEILDNAAAVGQQIIYRNMAIKNI